MKSKNVVSLSVAAVFVVLTISGLLIYLGQATSPVKHIHAWFGILFLGAAVFHILNNWSSIKAYSVNKKAGGIRRELILPVLAALLFAGGIAADLPVFKDLGNAGKRAFGPKKKESRQLSQAAVDSIAQKLINAYELALSQGDTASLARLVAKNALLSNETGRMANTAELGNLHPQTSASAAEPVQLERATAINEHLIVAVGTVSRAGLASVHFINVLSETDLHWQLSAQQLATMPASAVKVAIR
jgi:hypothetical protein